MADDIQGFRGFSFFITVMLGTIVIILSISSIILDIISMWYISVIILVIEIFSAFIGRKYQYV